MPDYREPSPPSMTKTTTKEFRKVVETRRAVKRFTDDIIPEEVVSDCLDMALLAPSSGNIQPWEFIVIKTPKVKQQAIKFCMNQNAAKTSSVLIAVIARTDTMNQNCQDVLDIWPERPVPKIVTNYYAKSSPINFALGPLNAVGKLKWGATKLGRLATSQVIPETHYNLDTIKLWATKSTALAAENLMLAFRAHGYDSCPMEGFDEMRMKKLLGLHKHQHIIMMLGAGKRAEDGVYHPQFRLPRERFVKEV